MYKHAFEHCAIRQVRTYIQVIHIFSQQPLVILIAYACKSCASHARQIRSVYFDVHVKVQLITLNEMSTLKDFDIV